MKIRHDSNSKIRHKIPTRTRSTRSTRKVIGKGHRLYKIWDDMIQRCTNPNDKDYPNYGGRGIRIHRAWRKDFRSFCRWALANGYADDLTIDRVETNGNYQPGNIRWATQKEQANNRRTNVIIDYDGRSQTIQEWCDELGLPYHTIYARLQRQKWTPEKAFTQPIRRRQKGQTLPTS